MEPKDYLKPNDDGTPREVMLKNNYRAWIITVCPQHKGVEIAEES